MTINFNEALAEALSPSWDMAVADTLVSWGGVEAEESTVVLSRAVAEDIYAAEASVDPNPYPPLPGMANPVGADGKEVDLSEVDVGAITPEFFESLHSLHQLYLVKRFDGELILAAGKDNRLDVLLSSDGKRVLILQRLTKASIAGLSLADQSKIAVYINDEDFPETLRVALEVQWGLETGAGEDMKQLIDDLIKSMKEINETNSADYIDQLKLIKQQLDKAAMFSQVEIAAQVQRIKERFDRMNVFDESIRSQVITVGGKTLSASPFIGSSLDGGATIKSGFNLFLAQEKRMLEAQRQRLAVLTMRNLDVPTLISILQMTYNVRKEVEVTLLTEELQQYNALLKDYSVMQQLLNDVLKDFSSGKDDEKLTIGGKEGASSLTTEELKAVGMFQDLGSLNEFFRHPLEVLRNINRPRDQIFVSFGFAVPPGSNTTATAISPTGGTVAKTQSQWSIFSTQLADAVTVINQQSQILTNDISNFSQEQNRHFELANSALRRLMDMINTIAHM